jgi:hypothetical protein
MENAHRVAEQMEETTVRQEGRELRTGEQVLVQCEGYRCLAFRDRQGKWRSAPGGQELPKVLRVLQQF